MMSLLSQFVLLMAAVGIYSGCASAAGIHRRVPEYQMGTQNVTSQMCDKVIVTYMMKDGARYYHEFGTLSPSSIKEVSDEPDPIPRKVTVTWRTADGKPHEQEVDIPPHVVNDPEFSGTIWLKVTATGIVVRANTKADQRERAIAQKSIVPD